MTITENSEEMKKKIFSKQDVVDLFHEFYMQVKHGDEEHQRWLLRETLDFINYTVIRERDYGNTSKK